MNTIIQVLQILVLVAFGIVALILSKGLPSYLSKKGENIATKEDIGGITNSIEQIRLQYSTKLEEIRVSINSLTEKEKEYNQKQNENLCAFHDLAIVHDYAYLGFSFGELPLGDGKVYYEYQQEFSRSIIDLLCSYHRLVLFLEPGSELKDSADKVMNTALQTQAVFKKQFGSVKRALLDEFVAFNSGDMARTDKTVHATNEANKLFWDEMGPVKTQFENDLLEYVNALNKYLRPVSS